MTACTPSPRKPPPRFSRHLRDSATAKDEEIPNVVFVAGYHASRSVQFEYLLPFPAISSNSGIDLSTKSDFPTRISRRTRKASRAQTEFDEISANADDFCDRPGALGMALADWSERWFPDAFVFALVALVIVFLAGFSLGTPARDLVKYFGEGFWSLIPFTMQMAIIIVGGYVVATSPPVYRLICRLARIPKTPRVAPSRSSAFFSIATAMISWGFRFDFLRLAGARSRKKRAPRSTIAPSAPQLIWAIAACGLSVFPRPPRC